MLERINDLMGEELMLWDDHIPVRHIMSLLAAFFDEEILSRICFGISTKRDWGKLAFNHPSEVGLSPKSTVTCSFPVYYISVNTKIVTIDMEEFYYYLTLTLYLSLEYYESTQGEIEAFKQGLAHIHKVCEIKDIYEDRIKKYCEENEIEETI